MVKALMQDLTPFLTLTEILFKTGIGNEISYSRLNTLIKIGDSDDALQHNVLIARILLEILNQKGGILSTRARIKEAFDLSQIDLGYTYKDGIIIKSGAVELDGKLILENLQWLKSHPLVRERFSNALTFYFTKKLEDAITNAYSALESLAKIFLNTNKRLDDDNTRTDLVSKLTLDSEWGQILYNYSKIAHQFSTRHGQKNQNINMVDDALVEFYIYLTGTFIRLISNKMPSNQVYK